MKNMILNALSVIFAAVILINYSIYIVSSIIGGVKTWNLAVAVFIFLLTLLPLLALFIFGDTVRKNHRCLVDILQTVYACGMGIYVITFVVFSVWVTSGVQYEAEKQYDTVIVFGGGISNGKINHDAQTRLECAGEYISAHPDCICIVSGGIPTGMDVSEAEVMKNALSAYGIDPARVFLENKAKNTWENLKYSLEMASGSILCISSDYHVKRIEMMASDHGYIVDTLASRPQYSVKKHSSLVREYMAYAKYFLGLNDT